MNRSELTSSMAAWTSVPGADADRVVAEVFAIIAEALARGEKVPIAGFGNFATWSRAVRQGLNPTNRREHRHRRLYVVVRDNRGQRFSRPDPVLWLASGPRRRRTMFSMQKRARSSSQADRIKRSAVPSDHAPVLLVRRIEDRLQKVHEPVRILRFPLPWCGVAPTEARFPDLSGADASRSSSPMLRCLRGTVAGRTGSAHPR